MFRVRQNSYSRARLAPTLWGLLLAIMSYCINAGADETRAAQRSYDRDLLKMGIHFTPPVDWRREIERQPHSLYVGFYRTDATAVISVSIDDIDAEEFQRVLLTVPQKEQTSLGGTPCYDWIQEDVHKEGFKVKRKAYTFFKNGKSYLVAYSAQLKEFEAYLPAFEQAISTFELVL